MLKIEVKQEEVVSKSIQTRKGTTVELREQTLWVHGLQAYPIKAKRVLWRDDQPYAPGFYTIDPSSFYVNRYEKLELDLGLLKATK